MSDTEAVPATKKKSGKKKIILALIALVVIGGGGVGAGLYASSAGLIGGGHAKEEDPDRPKLVLREGVDEAEAERYASADGSRSPDPRKFKATYVPITESFTANLADSDSFVQVAIGVSTYYDERVVENITSNEMAVRSAVLMTLSNQDTMAVATPQGKSALKEELKKAINAVLKAKEGFGGVDDVYFTNFVIQ